MRIRGLVAARVEVASTHTGMAFDPAVYSALGPLLTSWARDRRPLAA